MIDFDNRLREFTFTFDADQMESIPGGYIVRGVSIDYKRREYRHSTPSKYYFLKKSRKR